METPENGGGRVGIVLSGSPLFNGDAGSGPSEIRRWLLEQDLVEAIVALPTDMFFNTGIGTYIWILTNHKEPRRKNQVQLINLADIWTPMRKSQAISASTWVMNRLTILSVRTMALKPVTTVRSSRLLILPTVKSPFSVHCVPN